MRTAFSRHQWLPWGRGWLPWAIVCLLAAGEAGAIAPLVNVTLEPRQISIGDSAQLTITSTGNGMDAINLPVVAGLEFRVVGQSRRVEMINGATLSTTSVVLRVTPQVAGIFTIPGITPRSQPLVLRVNPDTGAASSPYNTPNATRQPSAAGVGPGGSSPSGIRMTADGSAFVRMNLPKRDVYVGESIPVDIEVGMRAGFVTSLNGLPTLTGNDFTLNNLSRKPERVEKLIDGRPFTVLTWHSVLAPVKPGTFSLSVQSPLTVRIRTRSPRDSMIDDLLGDPFLQNYFGATVPKDINVASPPAELTVLALPTEGRPAGFSGAVGTFKITSDLSSPTAAVGDPLTLRLHVTGSGNFDRVDTPMLEHVDRWKTYPPKSSFSQGDPIGYKGEKTFEQPLIAAQPGAQTLPDLAFSYFDPNTHRYETLRNSPPRVTIEPALADAAVPPAPAASANADADANARAHASATPQATAQATAQASGLKPDHDAAGAVTSSLVPLYYRPRFLVLPSLVALAFAGGWLGLRRVHSNAPPRRRGGSRSQAVYRQLQPLQAAARTGDTVGFFTAARAVLQNTLAERWHVAPADITPDAVAARWGSGSDAVLRIFALADEVQYAGDVLTATDFDGWMNLVRRVVAEDA